MPGRLKPFWRMLAQSFPLKWPRARLRSELGAEALALAESVGLVDAVPIAPGDSYPCRCPQDGCAMRVFEDRGLVAVCGRGSDCLDEAIPEEDGVWLQVNHAHLGRVLQRALRLDVRPVERRGSVLFLGERSVGATAVQFALALRPQYAVRDGAIDRASSWVPNRVPAVLSFTEPGPGVPREVGGVPIAWVPLAEAFVPERVPHVDLAAFWLARAPDADLRAELWPRYTFVVDLERSRFGYAGRALDLQRQPMGVRFLARLLREPGQWVSRLELLRAVWHDDTFKEEDLKDVDIDRQLRQAKSELSKAFNALEVPPGVARDPIENFRARDKTDGGYRIDVERDRVLFLT